MLDGEALGRISFMSVHFRTLLDHVISFVLLRPEIPHTFNSNWKREKPTESEPVASKKEEPPEVVHPVVQQVALVYPVLPPKPYRHGDGMQAFHAAHPLPEQRQRTQPVTTRLAQLPIQIQQKVIAQLPPGGIARRDMENIPTAKRLSPNMLPSHVTGQIPVSSGKLPGNKEIMERARQHAPGHSTHLEPVAPEQVSQSLWIEQLDQQQPASAFLGDPNSHTSPLHGTWNAEEQTPPFQPVAPPEWMVEEPTLPTRRDSNYLLCQPPTLYFWDEFVDLAKQGKSEEETPTAQVPSVMRQRVTQRYKESE